ncbi:uncharacterized protein APUU_11084S [Aspergillus puulaauensis]|uniref:NAD(P)-binding protein n=1 Tax=Aspergillus puulaauensis TaxID=1220207 RepID=A0A7R7XB94_9EURO|nr:uncharacterized protein APUU_11084S [Aspergillus puulaauensis]BCS18256.1 hypothetical protein APUU_11084S [Aspergillus puulaauensis]
MSSYAITGASRGIGWAFVSILSSNPSNTVIALVRNKAATDKRVAEELPGRTNIHVLRADLDSYSDLEIAAEDTSKITGGSLDYLIANAALLTLYDQFDSLGVLGKDPVTLEQEMLANFKTNTIAQVHLFNLFTPLILRGAAKKVIAITSGHADVDLVTKFNVDTAGVYSISKVGLNMAVAKFSAQYSADGVLFLSLSPGLVDTGGFAQLTDEQRAGLGVMLKKFQEYAPSFTGPISPEDSVTAMLSVIDNATVEKDAGAFLSHKGDRNWL